MIGAVLISALMFQFPAEVGAGIRCAVARLSPAEAEAVGTVFLNRNAPADAQLEQVAGAVVPCTSRDVVLRRLVMRGTVAELGRLSLRRHLSERGIDMDLVDRLFDNLPPEVRTSNHVMRDNAEAFARQLIAAGADGAPLLEQGRTLGLYLGTRVGISRARLGLPGED